MAPSPTKRVRFSSGMRHKGVSSHLLPANSACFRLNGPLPRPDRVRISGSRREERQRELMAQQNMQSFQVERQADQTPFPRSGDQTPQRELAEAQHLFDNANHGLDRAFAQTIDGFANVCLKLVSHLDHGAGIVGRRCGLLGKAFLPIFVKLY